MQSTFNEFAWVLATSTLFIAVYLARRAPAVALGLVGGLVFGTTGLVLAHGREVPARAAAWAVVGLVVFGIVGTFARPSASRRFLWLCALVTVLIAPLIAAIIWNEMRGRCHAYDPPTTKFCAGTDLFFGISGVVMGYVVIATIVIVVLFAISAVRARRPGPGGEVRESAEISLPARL